VTDYLSVEEVLGIIVDEGFTLADPGLLASAVVRPQMSVFGDDAYPTVWLKAAALLESLGRNHPLEDGNKRIALIVTDVFLALNGWSLERGEGLELAGFVVRVVTGQVPLTESADYLEHHSSPPQG
jgi:death-on-curing protein